MLDQLDKVRKTLLFILPYLYEDVKIDKFYIFSQKKNEQPSAANR